MYPISSVTVRSASANRKAFTYNENNKKHDNNKKGDVFMNKKMRLWVAGTVGVLMTGLMSVNAYALEEKDVIGTWYVNELSMGGDILFHPGVMGMEVTVDIKEGGQMETITSYSGEEPEADQSEWKIENDKLLMTYSDQTVECEYADGKITITADGTTMILSQEKEEYEPYVPGKPVENPTMEDFKGEWICTLMDAFGMQMPVNSELTGFEMMLSIQEDKSELRGATPHFLPRLTPKPAQEWLPANFTVHSDFSSTISAIRLLSPATSVIGGFLHRQSRVHYWLYLCHTSCHTDTP